MHPHPPAVNLSGVRKVRILSHWQFLERQPEEVHGSVQTHFRGTLSETQFLGHLVKG